VTLVIVSMTFRSRVHTRYASVVTSLRFSNLFNICFYYVHIRWNTNVSKPICSISIHVFAVIVVTAAVLFYSRSLVCVCLSCWSVCSSFLEICLWTVR
jgi:hypothetical protein